METIPLDLRPGRCAELQLGAALLRGTRTVHIVLDPRCDRLYELGAREYFILSRLDGNQSLSQVGDEYAAQFGRRLGAAEWGRLLTLLASRNLLAGQAPAGARQAPAVTAPGSWRRGNRPLPRLSALVRTVHAWLPARIRGYLLCAAAIAAAGMLAVLADRLPELASQAVGLRVAPWLLLPLLALLCLGAVCHELAHGFVALNLGVRTVRIGVRWDLPLVIPYCQAEEVLVLPRRRQRVAAALAGPLSHWVFLIPFFALWLVVPSGETRDAIAALLLVHATMGLFSCGPWPGSDGYLAFSNALNVSQLHAESLRYLRLTGRGRDATAGYSTRARWVYSGYTAALVVTSGALTAVAIWLVLRAAGAL